MVELMQTVVIGSDGVGWGGVGWDGRGGWFDQSRARRERAGRLVQLKQVRGAGGQRKSWTLLMCHHKTSIFPRTTHTHMVSRLTYVSLTVSDWRLPQTKHTATASQQDERYPAAHTSAMQACVMQQWPLTLYMQGGPHTSGVCAGLSK